MSQLLPYVRRLPAMVRLQQWWRQQSPHRQDRYAMLAPLVAVLLFLAAIVAAFGYLRLEEMEREQEAVRRDVEYAQQRMRLRLLERQEELVRLAQEISGQELDAEQFRNRASVLVNQFPELQGLSWIDERRRLRAAHGHPSLAQSLVNSPVRGDVLPEKPSDTENAFALARELRQPIYLQRNATPDGTALLELHLPLHTRTRFAGVLLAEYSLDTLYRYGVPSEVSARYAVSLRDSRGEVLAGSSAPKRNRGGQWTGWASHANDYEVPVSPVGNGLVLHAQAYRDSLGVVGSGLFWLVGTLSVMTAWMLIANWRHTRRRMQAQQALVLETNFRRAMENSMPTGMRALDLQGHITYVNAAFCQMTGWSERELVGCTAPFPYWPEEDRDMLMGRLEDELTGRVTPGGFQVRVKRKDGTLFDARIYVSPLIDARGLQTGWMTSMTDITEPNRVREQLYASYERFTTVLEALDASVSVAPLGTDELLFANKLYRLWFHEQSSNGHVRLSTQAGLPARVNSEDSQDSVDGLVGMPTSALPDAEAENAEVYDEELGKWLEVRTRYLTWVDGRLAQMVIATDITPRRLAEAQAAAQAERAQTASRLITMGEMASSVAHELNQPLTAINNYCNGMVSRIKAKQISEEDLLGALEKTARQAQRAGQIIQRIRAFVKRSEPNRTLSEVAVMVNEAVELAEIELRRYNVRLSYFMADLPPVLVDPILIEQVLVNLLKNAAESIVHAQRPAPHRRVELHVLPAVVEGKPVVEFTVTDTGRGIAPEVMARLYEAFHTTKAEGMGIGLSLCRSIVESHHGRMKAENLYNGEEVSGCRFTFWLPVDAPAATPAPSQLQAEQSQVRA
ncbi:MAG: PAS domain-containing sensor histidine kinase [Hylemonella sp.]|nr:PAS domain-containing sensor histidine kinase [Hylemonella sp.]